MEQEWIKTIFTGLLAAVPGLVALMLQGRKDRADITGKMEEVATKEAERADKKQDRIDDLQVEYDAEIIKRRNSERIAHEWLIGIGKLAKQLDECGIVPAWKPKQEDIKLFVNGRKTKNDGDDVS